MKSLTNAEFILLSLILERPGISGYELNHLVEGRGYREWADIGRTSIYVGLKKIQNSGFTETKVDTNKTGKGPLPLVISATPEGKNVFLEHAYKYLSTTRESDSRFALALAGMGLLEKARIISAMKDRIHFLEKVYEELGKKEKSEINKGMPLGGQLIFSNTRLHIEKEIDFMRFAIKKIEKREELI